ncbi:MAG: preprotein translocase subunit SecA [Candidatus Berkelbacteria bacterium]|nr:preprotein translocase subunit SecA [Candidatus Berkelbacteria bacterium]
MRNLLRTIFGGGNQRELNRLDPQVKKINELESEFEALTDAQLKAKTGEFRERVEGGEALDDLIPEAFATVREAAKREIKQRHFDVQLIGGLVLHHGKIAEMKTGEGKTLVATLPLYLNALAGKGAHLVTVNDYLAKFQGEWMGRIYDRLGMTTGIIQNQGISFVFDEDWGKKSKKETEGENITDVQYDNLRPCMRGEAYEADITYGTNNEFGFDYLRDNMAQHKDQSVQRGLFYAIVDEVDSILIDEARTPLIISAPAEESADLYARFAMIVPRLTEKKHYEVDEKARAVSLTDEGIQYVEKELGVTNIYDPDMIAQVHHLEEALKAQILFKKDRDYVVRDGEVIIVDEFTGRMMPGRRFSEGLHQAIEAKEGVEIKRESETLATISFQNLFRLYDKLAGMTGTAATEAEEFHKIYKLDVVEVPTNKPMIRADCQDQIYKTEESKFRAIVEKIKSLNENGQPVLVGTISIEKSERLSKMLKRSGIPHEVLNAKHHEKEAKIIAQAGRFKAVTVATNMAGRGVDIILGGNPPVSGEAQKVIDAGGLFVLGTERHESRRIDNQLRGRSGRQGDPGDSQFYISMEDDLMRIFGGERLRSLMDRLGLPDDQPIEHSVVSKSIENAQRRVEGHNFDIRKHLVEYDDVMNRQREILYKRRHSILLLDPNKDSFLHDQVLVKMSEEERSQYKASSAKVPLPIVFDLERRIYLSVIDQLWVEHLNTMDSLRDSIGLRGYGQVDPLVVYKQESYTLFEGLIKTIDDEAIGIILKIDFSQIQALPARKEEAQPLEYHGADTAAGEEVIEKAAAEEETDVIAQEPSLPARLDSAKRAKSHGLPEKPAQEIVPKEEARTKGDVVTLVRSVGDKMNQTVESSRGASQAVPKVGRNEPCPCRSGKKYKKCHGR